MYQVANGEFLVTAAEVKYDHDKGRAYIDGFDAFCVEPGEIVSVAHTLIQFRVLAEWDNRRGRMYLERINE